MNREQLVTWARESPPGTMIPAAALADALAANTTLQNDTPQTSSPTSWREKLWTVPAETRIGLDELCEALARPRSFVYRRTSKKTDLPRIPHRTLDGRLSFVIGEIRSWIERNEIVVERGIRSPLQLHRRAGRGQ